VRSAFYAFTTTVQSAGHGTSTTGLRGCAASCRERQWARIAFPANGPQSAPPVCFLHGGAAHAHWFDRVIPALSGRFHVISLDQRGHGESQWAKAAAYATEDFRGRPARAHGRGSLGADDACGSFDGRPTTRWASPPGTPNARRPRRRGRAAVSPATRPGPAHARERGRRPRGCTSRGGGGGLVPPACRARRSPIRRCSPTWPRMGLTRVRGGFRYASTRPATATASRWTAGRSCPRHRADLGSSVAEHFRRPARRDGHAHARDIPRAELVEIPGRYHHLTLDTPEAFSVAPTRSCAARCESRYPGTPARAAAANPHRRARRLTTAAPCETLVAMVQRSGADARVTVYLDRTMGSIPPGRGRPGVCRTCGSMALGSGVRPLGPNPTAAQPARDNVRRQLEDYVAIPDGTSPAASGPMATVRPAAADVRHRRPGVRLPPPSPRRVNRRVLLIAGAGAHSRRRRRRLLAPRAQVRVHR